VTLVALLATIDSTRNQENLSSAVRLFVLNFYRAQLEIRDRHKAIEAALRGSIRLHWNSMPLAPFAYSVPAA
jgi:predicted DNA-binding ribbon-helix-helix protein